jgi:hypothetical protein
MGHHGPRAQGLASQGARILGVGGALGRAPPSPSRRPRLDAVVGGKVFPHPPI